MRKQSCLKGVTKGALIQVITRRVVLANEQHTAIGASHSSAAQEEAVVPHDLRVVAAHGVGEAGVGLPVVVLVLQRPRLHGLLRRPVIVHPPEHVLPVRTVRVAHHAVFLEPLTPSPGVPREPPVPRVQGLVVLFPHHVVRLQELPRLMSSSCRRDLLLGSTSTSRVRNIGWGAGGWWW